MRVDYPTLLLAVSWTTTAFAVLGLFLARAEPALRLLRLSSLGNLCFTVGMPLLILRGGPYDAAGIVFGNGFIFAGWGLQAVCVRRLAGRSGWRWLPLLASLAWGVACLVPAFLADTAARVMLASALTASLSGLVTLGLGQCWTGWHRLRIPILLICGA